MEGKNNNNKKVITVSLAISLAAVIFGLAGNANSPTLSFAQETTGQITKGTIVLGNIESANLTSGQIQNNTLKNGEWNSFTSTKRK